jgi:hypothetical protein
LIPLESRVYNNSKVEDEVNNFEDIDLKPNKHLLLKSGP